MNKEELHIVYDVVQLENGRVIIKGDGHYSTDDREGTEFDFGIKEIKLIKDGE